MFTDRSTVKLWATHLGQMWRQSIDGWMVETIDRRHIRGIVKAKILDEWMRLIINTTMSNPPPPPPPPTLHERVTGILEFLPAPKKLSPLLPTISFLDVVGH